MLEKRAMDAPPAWTLLITGLVTGIVIGVFGCFLLYLSGNVPPLQAARQPAEEPESPSTVVTQSQAATVQAASSESTPEQAAEVATIDTDELTNLSLGFYDELRDYEVTVDATPVPLPPAAAIAVQVAEAATPVPSQAASGAQGRLLQIGAFEQMSSAERQVGMLEELGVDAVIRQQSVTGGRTLYLVQAGPFGTPADLNAVRSLLQRNDISSFPLDPR